MAIPTIKSTYVMDVATVRALERIARRWNVSKSEALRRAIHASAERQPPEATDALHALDQLQRSLKLGRFRAWLAQSEPIGISAVGWTESLYGPVEPHDIELAAQVVSEPLPLLARDAGMAARLFNMGGRRRGSLNGCMIAAIALRAGASVATTNVADFRRFETAGLRVLSGDGRA